MMKKYNFGRHENILIPRASENTCMIFATEPIETQETTYINLAKTKVVYQKSPTKSYKGKK